MYGLGFREFGGLGFFYGLGHLGIGVVDFGLAVLRFGAALETLKPFVKSFRGVVMSYGFACILYALGFSF